MPLVTRADSRLFRDYYSVADPDYTLSTALNQEVLLSYRLLFGQDSRSRSLFDKITKSYSTIDPLLKTLCTKGIGKHIYRLPIQYWPQACRRLSHGNQRLQEQSTYNLNTDFPMLADHLAELQDYMRIQKPSRKRDLWRDRRNKGEWLASWPVLIFAALAIVLSFLQLLVAFAQLYYAIHPPK
jgi:hypothetical protein